MECLAITINKWREIALMWNIFTSSVKKTFRKKSHESVMYEHVLVLMVARLNMIRMDLIGSVLVVSGGTCRLLNSCRPLGTQRAQFLKTRPQWGTETESEKIVLIVHCKSQWKHICFLQCRNRILVSKKLNSSVVNLLILNIIFPIYCEKIP